jgi:hypothetical protein
VVAPARQVATFLVQERHLRARREELRNLSYQGLQQYFADKLLDRQSYAGLKALLDGWAEISRLERVIGEQEQRRAELYERQGQAQKNMSVLSSSGDEGQLRGRYVKQIAESEEALAAIEQKIKQTRSEIEHKQAQINQMIKTLGGQA